ncbi:hypothetical protein NA56DRAFT_699566 [Hyaloscypha hepaticicola]|uniref:Uncharacterized protein n=1 Tax=Hyaloscypha hepaticicola TaxID=2082293 RepID=A0A2J6QET6_9HELO|nr:hypothetical protein NA56DRAFT_699566 [Hyaloscypha hepaticicola]
MEERKRTERGSRKERYIEAEQDSAERTRKGERDQTNFLKRRKVDPVRRLKGQCEQKDRRENQEKIANRGIRKKNWWVIEDVGGKESDGAVAGDMKTLRAPPRLDLTCPALQEWTLTNWLPFDKTWELASKQGRSHSRHCISAASSGDNNAASSPAESNFGMGLSTMTGTGLASVERKPGIRCIAILIYGMFCVLSNTLAKDVQEQHWGGDHGSNHSASAVITDMRL